MTSRQPDPGALDERILIICAVVILGSFMSNLDTTIVNVAPPEYIATPSAGDRQAGTAVHAG
jgi:hypothetical protein